MTIYDSISSFIASCYDETVIGNKHFILTKNGENFRIINRKNPLEIIELTHQNCNDTFDFIQKNEQYIIRMISVNSGMIYNTKNPEIQKGITFYNEVIEVK